MTFNPAEPRRENVYIYITKHYRSLLNVLEYKESGLVGYLGVKMTRFLTPAGFRPCSSHHVRLLYESLWAAFPFVPCRIFPSPFHCPPGVIFLEFRSPHPADLPHTLLPLSLSRGFKNKESWNFGTLAMT